MSKIITIKEASISTLSVELKAIHINGKQLTLSVFRQIQEEKIFDDEFKIKGIAWGLVNYFWDKAPQFETDVIHIVWQKGDELRRWRLPNIKDGRRQWPYYIDDINWKFYGQQEQEIYEIDQFLSGKESLQISRLSRSIRHPTHYEKDGKLDLYDENKPDSAYAVGLERIKTRNREKEADYQKAKELLAEKNIRKAELEIIFSIRKSDALLYIENWRSAYNHLSALPQLYIAA